MFVVSRGGGNSSGRVFELQNITRLGRACGRGWLTFVLCITDSFTTGEIWSSFSVSILGGVEGWRSRGRLGVWLNWQLGHVFSGVILVVGAASEGSLSDNEEDAVPVKLSSLEVAKFRRDSAPSRGYGACRPCPAGLLDFGDP